MGSKICCFRKPVDQIKMSVQCCENPEGLDGVTIYDDKMFAMNKHPLGAVTWCGVANSTAALGKTLSCRLDISCTIEHDH